MRTGVPCNENRLYPVRISTQGKTCSGTVLALYGIAVYITPAVAKIVREKNCEGMGLNDFNPGKKNCGDWVELGWKWQCYLVGKS